MTCKDCLLHGHCRYTTHTIRNDKGEYIQFPACLDDGVPCEGFKDKSRIVELPIKATDELRAELTEYCHNRCVDEL